MGTFKISIIVNIGTQPPTEVHAILNKDGTLTVENSELSNITIEDFLERMTGWLGSCYELHQLFVHLPDAPKNT